MDGRVEGQRVSGSSYLTHGHQTALDRVELMDKLVDEITGSRLSVVELAKKARVGHVTLYRWINGDTKNGHLTTIDKVVRALGKRLEIR
jgi:DNA-binding phage protein